MSIEGDLGGDALLQFKPYKHFLIDFHLNIAVKYKGHSLASVKCVGTIEGPGLWRIKGKATFSILWWDIDCPFDESWGTPPPLDGTSTNVQAELQNALRQTSNWSAQLPAGSDAFVTLAPPAGTTIPLAHPLGRFAFSQNVVPLGLTLERYGSGAVTGPTRFDLEHVKVGGVEVTSRTMVREQFARAQYLEESDDEVLARPSFEPMDAGVEFAGVGFEVPASGTCGSFVIRDLICRRRAADVPVHEAHDAGVANARWRHGEFARDVRRGGQVATARSRADVGRHECARRRHGAAARGCAARHADARDGRGARWTSCVRAGDRGTAARRDARRHRAGGRVRAGGGGLMSDARYRFLPWSRRGLAARVPTEDAPTKVLAPRAKVSVGLTVTTIAEQTVDLSLYGPGDVIGVDPRMIVRTDPRPLSADVEPNYMPLIEFDPPDFPWMFTPARADTSDRLRPWCVLIVVDLAAIAAPRPKPGAPLPTLDIPATVLARELPDLAESWAWAHTQLLTDAAVPDVPSELAQHPERNVSRLHVTAATGAKSPICRVSRTGVRRRRDSRAR